MPTRQQLNDRWATEFFIQQQIQKRKNMKHDNFTDQEYYEQVCKILKEKGFDRPDYGTVIDDKYSDKTPEESAQAFIDDWTDGETSTN